MPNCRVYPPDYVEKAGCDVDLGSVVSIAFIDEGVDFIDISDPAEWIGQNIIVLPDVRGLYNKFASTEVEGKGKQATRVSGRKHAVIFKAESVKSNEPFWNILNRATNYKIAFVTGSDYDTLYYTDKNISTDAGPIIERNLDSIIQWEVSAKWSDLNVPLTSEVPAGIFDGSYQSVVGGSGIPLLIPFIIS